MADLREYFNQPLTTIVDHNRRTTNATTRYQLANNTGTSMPCSAIIIFALPTNTGYVYLGGSAVAAANGLTLTAGQAVSIALDNANKLYFDVSVSGEGLTYMVLS